MSQEISFENLQYTNRDRCHKIRMGDNDISFSYLSNHVAANMDDRIIAIEVDDYFRKMCEKIDGNVKPDDWTHHYFPHTGEYLLNPIGEQLIVFCETDFMSLMKNSPVTLEQIGNKQSPPVVRKPTTDEELEVIHYKNYEYLASIAEEVIRSNLYVNLFPPLVKTLSNTMCKTYFDYIIALRHEYIMMLDFCFNMDFYEEELDGITSASRFHLYCEINDMIPARSLNMSFRFERSGFGNIKATIKDKKLNEVLKRSPLEALDSIQGREANAFERKYGISPATVDLARVLPVPIVSSYKCGSLEDILFLEFEKMLELDLRIKKCKHCERYFILKGNYQTEYCDRVPEGETQNCQSISAAAKYAKKVKDNPALAIFNRAYKRNHARLKVGSVKSDAFKKWQSEALIMRDKCMDGKITLQEFGTWIDADKGR